jgi:hypothetical protein
MVAVIRPDDWNVALFVHVAGAMLTVAALLVATAAAAGARRGGDDTAALTRFSFRTLLLAALPAFIVMRVGAEWIASKEDLDDPSWLGIGYSASDGGLLLTVIAIVVAWRATKRRPEAAAGVRTAVLVLCAIVLVAYLVTVWAMTAKPS